MTLLPQWKVKLNFFLIYTFLSLPTYLPITYIIYRYVHYAIYNVYLLLILVGTHLFIGGIVGNWSFKAICISTQYIRQ